MRKEILDYLNSSPQLLQFIREQPKWYRKLTRNPHELQLLEISSMHHYKKRFHIRLKSSPIVSKWRQ